MQPMSALPELAFESTRTLTQEEFAAWVAARWRGDLNHYELLDGKVVMTPPAGYPQGAIAAALGGILEPFVRQRKLGKCFDSSQGFELPSGDTGEPDHRFVSSERWAGGQLVMTPGKAGTQEKIVPIEAFFRKIVAVRERLRVLEQRINTHPKLADEDRVQLQDYITRAYGSLTTFNVLFADPEDRFIGTKGSEDT